jgi:hypothetical protein
LKRKKFRKSLNAIFPDELVTSAPKSLVALVHVRPSKDGAANCCVVTRAMLFLTPSGLVKNDAPSSVTALRLTSANRTRRSTWLLAPSSRIRSSETIPLSSQRSRRRR